MASGSGCGCTTSSAMSVEYSSEESESEHEELESDGSVVSLLDRLRTPMPADIARSRKVMKNDPPKGKRRCKGRHASDSKGVTPSQRVREFPKTAVYKTSTVSKHL